MKKHSLIEHWSDVSMWWEDSHDSLSAGDLWRQERQIVFFLAYERWTNDKDLLTVEDNYEWRSEPIPAGSARYGKLPGT